MVELEIRSELEGIEMIYETVQQSSSSPQVKITSLELQNLTVSREVVFEPHKFSICLRAASFQ